MYASLLLLSISCFGALLTPVGGHAQVPITSSGLNTRVSPAPGNSAQYDITGGTRPGSGPNLFHSFGDFNVPNNHTANFLNDTGLPTSNILGRVTGGNPSNIFGTIQTTGFGKANLFLMNPAGILFGPNASLNVGGSVGFTTADYLRLADGAKFTAVPGPQDAAISSTPVAAFGFLGSNPAAITVQGGKLAVTEAQNLSLVGGNIIVTAGAVADGTSQAARLSAPGGQIALVSVASPGEVTMNTTAITDTSLSGFAALGTISLSRGTVVDTSGDTAGRILIRAGQFIMEGADLTAHSTSIDQGPQAASVHAGGISIQADEVTLSRGSSLTTSTVNDTAGDITFHVGILRSNVEHDGHPIQGAAPVTISSVSTGRGGPGSISLSGPADGAADALLLSNTRIITSVTNAAQPTVVPGHIDMTAEHIELRNGTVLQTDSTGGADAGSITIKTGTLYSEAGPDGRVLLSSNSNCHGCLGGQAGDITIEGIPGVTPTETRLYVFVGTPESGPTKPITYHMARNIDLHGTDIRSEAAGNAPGGMVVMRAQDSIGMTDTTISVATQDFDIDGPKPSGELVRNQGFSRIDVLAHDITLKDSTIRADANVSDIGSCPLCLGGPSAGEIWFRTGNSFTADNSSIINSSRGRAQAGLTKIIGDHFFSFGAVWEPDYPDLPTKSVTLNHSEVTVQSVDSGLPGYLRIRGDQVTLNHSILNSKVNDVSNSHTRDGKLVDLPGDGERGRVIADGRDVQGSVVVSAKRLDITGGGIIAPTTGSRIASRIELLANDVTTRPGTGPGGTFNAPRILDTADPTRTVLFSGSTGSGGAGTITIAGEGLGRPEGTAYPPASSIRLTGTNVLTDTNSDALGGRIQMFATGPIALHNTTASANVTDVRPRSLYLEQGGNITLSAASLSVDGGGLSVLSRGTQTGGNIVVDTTGQVTLAGGASITASSIGSGNAGNIALNAGSQLLVHDSSITTDAAQASGGNIAIRAVDAIHLVNSRISTSVQGGPQTSGGNITIDPTIFTLQNGHVLAQAVQGQGGNISITAGTFLADQNSVVSASSEFGLSGSVTLQSPVSNVSGTLATLPQRPLEAQNLLRQHCAAQANGQLSSLVVSSRDTAPSEPGGWLSSPLAILGDATGSHPIAQSEDPRLRSIIEGRLLPSLHADQAGTNMRSRLFVDGCNG